MKPIRENLENERQLSEAIFKSINSPIQESLNIVLYFPLRPIENLSPIRSRLSVALNYIRDHLRKREQYRDKVEGICEIIQSSIENYRLDEKDKGLAITYSKMTTRIRSLNREPPMLVVMTDLESRPQIAEKRLIAS